MAVASRWPWRPCLRAASISRSTSRSVRYSLGRSGVGTAANCPLYNGRRLVGSARLFHSFAPLLRYNCLHLDVLQRVIKGRTGGVSRRDRPGVGVLVERLISSRFAFVGGQ